MKIRLLCAVAAALCLAACDDDNTEAKRPTRIVCQEQGRVTLDDFATDGVMMESGAHAYDSATTSSRMRASGQCVSYAQDKPAGWKPIIPGM